jgi:hypothetical protein
VASVSTPLTKAIDLSFIFALTDLPVIQRGRKGIEGGTILNRAAEGEKGEIATPQPVNTIERKGMFGESGLENTHTADK